MRVIAAVLLLASTAPADLVLEEGALKNTGPALYEVSVVSSSGEQEIGTFPAQTEVPAPEGPFTVSYRESPGGALKRRAFGAEAAGDSRTAAEGVYRYLPAALDASASRWLDERTYLLAVETRTPAVVRVFPREPVAAEIKLTSAGPEERYRMTTSSLRIWGESEKQAGPGERAYFFIGPDGPGPYRIFLQAEKNGRVSRPVAFSFDRPQLQARVRTP